MNKRHKHADVIHAWAEGKKIQIRQYNGWEDWDSHRSPAFLETLEYRIKPEPPPDEVRYLQANQFGQCFFSNDPNLVLTFDGETGKLKKAEVLE